MCLSFKDEGCGCARFQYKAAAAMMIKLLVPPCYRGKTQQPQQQFLTDGSSSWDVNFILGPLQMFSLDIEIPSHLPPLPSLSSCGAITPDLL